jgi:hypothetical protein
VQGIKGYQDAESELFAALQQIREALLSVDPNKTHILPWYDPYQGLCRRLPALRQGDKFPQQKNSMEYRYVAKWRLAWFFYFTMVRFRLGHDKPITAYLEKLRVLIELTILKVNSYVPNYNLPPRPPPFG